MKKYWIALAILFVLGFYSLYMAAFFAWVTATPLTATELRSAQLHCYVWFASLVISAFSFIAIGIRLFCLSRRSRHSNGA